VDFPLTRQVTALRLRGDTESPVIDTIAAEVPIALVFNGRDYAVMMATPADLEDFAIGFCLTEGIVGQAHEIFGIETNDLVTGVKLSITIPEARAKALEDHSRNLDGRTGCGLCGISRIEQVLRALPQLPGAFPISADAIGAAQRALSARQSLNQATGAVHAAAFANRQGEILMLREDVGRHNALDKLIGALTRAGLSPAAGFAFITSRCSMEMAQKAVLAGFPLLAAISAPTSMALTVAQTAGLTLAAFVRDSGFTLYAGAGGIVRP
jgi:FdhD protein